LTVRSLLFVASTGRLKTVHYVYLCFHSVITPPSSSSCNVLDLVTCYTLIPSLQCSFLTSLTPRHLCCNLFLYSVVFHFSYMLFPVSCMILYKLTDGIFMFSFHLWCNWSWNMGKYSEVTHMVKVKLSLCFNWAPPHLRCIGE